MTYDTTGAGASASNARVALINVLHLSDLHVGMTHDGWLWPALKSAFFADMRVVLHDAGLPDVVVFSGDLAQKATEEEYHKLQGILEELWSLFDEFGANPILVPVPGNHDLQRRPGADPLVLTMKEWWTSPAVQQAFWDDNIPSYREFVAQSFSNYQTFLKKLRESKVRLPENVRHGMIPGDISVELSIRGNTVGIVGLNSAWLQVDDADFERRLHVDARQLIGVIDGNPDDWCRRHAANLIVTHHPAAWLHPDSERQWRAEIYSGSRFDCHLFGHMHEPQSTSISEGGYEGRRLIQAASLFGLEWIGGQRMERIHGYSMAQIILAEQSKTLRQWPRRDVVGKNGVRKLVPDFEYSLVDFKYFDIEYPCAGEAATPNHASPDFSILSNPKALDALRKSLPTSEAAKHVRKVEQEICLESLSKQRLVWITTDWGLGEDEFLAELVAKTGASRNSVYQIDLGQYRSRDEMLSGIKRDIGVGFQQICDCISRESNCLLVLNDVVFDEEEESGRSYLSHIVDIAEGVIEYCPSVKLVIRSRRKPSATGLTVVELRSLNNVDAMIYIEHHPLGGSDLATDGFVRKIYSYTDGMPSRIDTALRDVQVLGLEGLHQVNTDVSGKAVEPLPPPPGLAETIAKLEDADDPGAARVFRLLAVLSMFPRGEYLETVRRFENAHPFHSEDAHRLIDLALVDTGEVSNIGGAERRRSAKSLIVRRPVREYLISRLPPDNVQRLNRQALALYFGEKWNSGAIKPPRDARFHERSCENWKVDNATLLVLREAKEAMASGNESRIGCAAILAESYCTALFNGEHYGSLIAAATEVLFICRDVVGHDGRLNLIKSLLGRSLRMSSYWSEARDVLEKLDGGDLSKAVRRKNLLNLALACESLKEIEDAKLYAKQCIALDKNSAEAMHSRAIILEQTTIGDPDRKSKLLKLSKAAAKAGSKVVAKNLLMTCMNESDDEEDIVSLGRQVIDGAERDDYTAMRAALRLCEMAVNKKKPLGIADLTRTMESYQYLLDESMDTLFGAAHRVLWKHFMLVGDTENLLRLFRHSSFKWQLRGRRGADRQYASEIMGLLGDRLRIGIMRSTREVAYLLVRSEYTMRLLPSS